MTKAKKVKEEISLVPSEISLSAMETVLVKGDLSKLTEQERMSYYGSVCKSVGLNPLTQPFAYITLNGKLTLYAKRDCTDQLRSINGISVEITGRESFDGVYVVTAKAKNSQGRTDESTGVVSLGAVKGEALANLFMKAETKAKRRVTLSICGLGLLDETEVETIKDAKPFKEVQAFPVEPKAPGDFFLKTKSLTGKLKDLDTMDLARLAVDMESFIHNDPDHPSANPTFKVMSNINAYLNTLEAPEDGPEDHAPLPKEAPTGANWEGEPLPQF